MKRTRDLSPAAQAVLDAVTKAMESEDNLLPYEQDIVAAALRAAADQVISPVPPPCSDFDEHAQGFLAAHLKYRRELLSIAAELEGTP